MRKEVLQELEDIIFLTAERCKALQYRNKTGESINPHRLRQGYLNSLSSLINAYARLSKDLEIDEVKEELKQLKKDLVR